MIHQNLILASRASRIPIYSPSQPRNIIFQSIGTKKRAKIILSGSGCSVPTCTMCPLPNYISKGQLSIRKQIEDFIFKLERFKPSEVAIYNDGSFFSNRELSNDDRVFIAKNIKKLSVSLLSIESLPQFIDTNKLNFFLEELGNKTKVEVGIGLQTFTDDYRKWLFGSSFSLKKFENAIDLIKFQNFIRVYLLTPLPLATISETERDLEKNFSYIKDIGARSLSICLLRPQPGTFVGNLHSMGLVHDLWPQLILKAQKSSQFLLFENFISGFKFDGFDYYTCGKDEYPWNLCSDCINGIISLLNSMNNNFSLCKNCEARAHQIEEKLKSLGKTPIERLSNVLNSYTVRN